MIRIDIDHIRGDYFEKSFPQTAVPLYVDGWFTLKDQKCESDDDAIIKISQLNGLEIVNGQPATNPALASVAYAANEITVIIFPEITAQIPENYPLFYDVQSKRIGGGFDNIITTHFNGRWSNIRDVTRRIS